MTQSLANICYSPMRREDVGAVHALETLCFSAPWDINDYYAELDNPTAHYLVARNSERIIGFAGMWAVMGEAHIVTLAVHSDFRCRGVGKQLLLALLAEARQQHVAIVTLEVRVSNVPAQKLYTAQGFRTISYRRKYYPDNLEDAAVMALTLQRS